MFAKEDYWNVDLQINTVRPPLPSSLEDVEYLTRLNKKIKIHLKINSGMNRYGFKDLRELKKGLELILSSKIIIEGVYTHFATTDEYVEKQMNRFKKFVKLVRKFNVYPIIHADNSFVNEKFNHSLDMVRVGFSLYARSDGWFLPVHEIKTSIVEVQNVKDGELVGYDYRFVAKKDMKIAIIPVGYADGFDLKCVGMKLCVNNKYFKVLNVCMDCFMLDITNSDLKKGDELFLMNKFNPISLYSNYLETSPYEVITKFSHMRADRTID